MREVVCSDQIGVKVDFLLIKDIAEVRRGNFSLYRFCLINKLDCITAFVLTRL